MKNTADAKTRKFDVTVNALGVYCSSIEVPADFSYEEALEYAKTHLDEIPMGTVDWIANEGLDEYNCGFDAEI